MCHLEIEKGLNVLNSSSSIRYTLLHCASPQYVPCFVHEQVHFCLSCFSPPPPLLHPLENVVSFRPAEMPFC